MAQRDDFSKETARTLGERVGLLCSNPACRALTKAAHTDDDRALSVGMACHIRAAAEGGPRYDALQSADERSSIKNGIWLCASCGTLIDKDEARFPVALLEAWKSKAEGDSRTRIGRQLGMPQTISVIDRLRAIPPKAIARLSYTPLNREMPHEVSITVDGVDEITNVFRFRLTMGAHRELPYGVPLEDVEKTWCPDGTHHVQVSGYLDHTLSLAKIRS